MKDHNSEIVIIRKPWNTTKKSMEFCAASPTSAPKCVLESGLEDTVSTSAKTNDFLHDSVDLSRSSGQADQDSDAKLKEEFENDFKRKRPKVTNKGKLPATKKQRLCRLNKPISWSI